MKYQIRKLLKDNDIIPNIVDTYPINALAAKSEKDFYTHLQENNCSVLCYHISRLTKYEIHDIQNNGLSWGIKQLFRNKIKNLPSCCDWFKDELIRHIENLPCTQAENAICASYGYLDLVEDSACDNIFHKDWGGETIYNHYDWDDGFQNEHFRKIHNTLQGISYPCIIVLRVSIQSFLSCPNFWYEKIKSENIEKLSGALEIEDELPEVVDIIDLNKYDSIDFN